MRWRSSIAFSIFSSISSISNGFWTKSKAPIFIASTAVWIEPNAVIRITAALGWIDRVVRSTSMPSAPPMRRSVSTTSNWLSCSRSMATVPFGASSTSWPALVSARTRPLRKRIVIVDNQNASHVLLISPGFVSDGTTGSVTRKVAPRPGADTASM